MGCEAWDWIYISQITIQWWVVNVEVNLEFLKRQGIYRLPERLLAYQEGLCSIWLTGRFVGWSIGWLGLNLSLFSYTMWNCVIIV
jgi:hypothetical protein